MLVDYKAKAKDGGGRPEEGQGRSKKELSRAFEPPPALDKANALFSVRKKSEF